MWGRKERRGQIKARLSLEKDARIPDFQATGVFIFYRVTVIKFMKQTRVHSRASDVMI